MQDLTDDDELLRRAAEEGAEVWIDVLRQLPRLKDAGAFTTWMYRIALNVAISFVWQWT